MVTYDAVIVGGGPAGSTCARRLAQRGLRVAVVDRAEFPRVKLCAGWLSAPIWDALELAPADYPHGLWEWERCHVHYRGVAHAVAGRGWFIRRYELDDFLLRRSGAELRLGAAVKRLQRVDDGWTIDVDGGSLHAQYVVGAGGTHCPVARVVAPERPRRALGVQELELEAGADAVARTRLGADGEPELLLFDGLAGYGWNVPKSEWVNVGCGTLDATAVHDAWTSTRAHLREQGHLPRGLDDTLAHAKGHSYYLFEPVHLDGAERDGALLVGDSLGLAHPITGEGILPAVISGRLAADAIADGEPASYPARLRRDPVLADYGRAHALLALGRRLRSALSKPAPVDGEAEAAVARSRRAALSARAPGRAAAITGAAVARGFAWMFTGARLPAPRLLDLVLRARAGEGSRR